MMNQLEQAYHDHLEQLKSFIYRLTTDHELTNDIVQDTFLKAHEKFHTFRQQSSIKTWLFSIAYHQSVDELRKLKRWSSDVQDKARTLAESDKKYPEHLQRIASESPYGKYEMMEHISACFTCITKTLPLDHQVTILLKDVYDFKVEEIATILDKTGGVVKHLLFNGRQKLVEIFDGRCALISKSGTCYQCSELNGFFNPKQNAEERLQKLEMVRQKDNPDREKLLNLREQLIKNINPLTSDGADVEDALMQILRKSIGEKKH